MLQIERDAKYGSCEEGLESESAENGILESSGPV